MLQLSDRVDITTELPATAGVFHSPCLTLRNFIYIFIFIDRLFILCPSLTLKAQSVIQVEIHLWNFNWTCYHSQAEIVGFHSFS